MITIEASKFNLKLAEPLSISFHTWHFRENVLITLRFEDVVGLGEAAPFKPITGDSQDEVIRQLKNFHSIPLDPRTDSPEALHAFLDGCGVSETLRAGIDFAYHDLIGKLRSVPVYGLYAEQPLFVENSVTLFIKNSPGETAAEAERICSLYPELKVMKIKLKGEGDADRVRAIRASTPPSMKFTLDANQGFSDPEEAVKKLTEIKSLLGSVLLVEEPCPKGELDKMKYVSDHLSFPVFADESAAVFKDAIQVIEKRAAQGINIKLQKAGGIWRAREIAREAKNAGLSLMVGSMVEGPIGMTAGAHFAASASNVMLTDLDMDLDVPSHAHGQAAFVNGRRIPSDRPGLGVVLDWPAIKSLVEKGDLIFEKII